MIEFLALLLLFLAFFVNSAWAWVLIGMFILYNIFRLAEAIYEYRDAPKAIIPSAIINGLIPTILIILFIVIL